MPEGTRRSRVQRFQLLGADVVEHTQDGQEWMPHWHTEWSIGAVVQGTCWCTVGGQPWRPTQGDLMAIAPGEVHTGMLASAAEAGDGGPGVRVLMVHACAQTLQRLGLPLPRESTVAHAPALAAQADTRSGPLDLSAWLRAATTCLGAAARPPVAPAHPPVPSAAERALLVHIRHAVQAGEHQVQALARQCGVSRARIHQIARKWIGMAPSDYLRIARLHQARSLLASAEPLASVAATCGFADQAHFTRWFRRVFGYTPGDWAQALHCDATSATMGA